MSLILRQPVTQVIHAVDGLARVLTIRKFPDQFAKITKSPSGGLGIPFGGVLSEDTVHEGLIGIKAGQASQVIGIVHVRVVGVQFNETFRCQDCRFRLIVLVIGIGNFKLCPFGVDAIGEKLGDAVG